MNNQFTKNFNKREFNSKDGARMPASVIPNVRELAKNLQVIRDVIGCPLHINSAYRSPAHNKRIGGVKNSQHLLGKAADIVSRNHSPQQLYAIIEDLINQGKVKEGGLGLYNSFVHYDIRGVKARWDNRK